MCHLRFLIHGRLTGLFKLNPSLLQHNYVVAGAVSEIRIMEATSGGQIVRFRYLTHFVHNHELVFETEVSRGLIQK